MGRKKRKSNNWTSAAARRMLEAAGGQSNLEEAVVTVVSRLRDGLSGPPTDLKAVADRLGVDGWKADHLPVAGELRREADGLRIAYSTGLSAGRRRFTIAHELGHAFFERSGPNCPRSGAELERICDLFATELLMPHSQALPLFAQRHPRAIIESARQFEVSLTAAMYRLVGITGVQAAIDVAGNRTVTMPALEAADDDLDEVVELARRNRVASAVARLGRNAVWNGSWKLEAEAEERGHLVVLTADPVDQDGVPVLRRGASVGRMTMNPWSDL
jgi:hypothetical protein